MKKCRILLGVILIFTLLALPAFSYAGTVQYATNYYTSTENSYSWMDDVSSYMSYLGYSYSRSHNPSASTIMSIIQGKDIFIWSGHDDPGTMITGSGNVYNAYATNATYCISDDVPADSINGTVWIQGCQGGLTSGSYGNLLIESVSKSYGYTNAYGVDITYGWSTGKSWNYYTWQYMYTRGQPMSTAIWDAANTAGQGDIYGFNSSHVKNYAG